MCISFLGENHEGSSIVSKECVEGYRILYVIEVGLREFLIVQLSKKAGPLWWKKRLPGDVLESFRKGRDYEKKLKWVTLLPHHPLYYIDFPDIKKIIQRSDNWKDVFSPIFNQKDIFIASLYEIESIRNSIAHCRKISQRELATLKEVFQKISSAIGKTHFLNLANQNSTATDIPSMLKKLKMEIVHVNLQIKELKEIEDLPIWNLIKESWWFEGDYLGRNLENVWKFFELIEAYRQFPRTRGTGHEIEEWIKTEKIQGYFQEAKCLLDRLIEDANG